MSRGKLALQNKVTKAVVLGATLLSSLAAKADWKVEGELGLVLAHGNTEQETINAKADMTSESERWTHVVGFSFLHSTSGDELTGDRYELHGQSDFKLSERSYALGSVRYENDEFSPYTYQAVASVGYGYKFYNSETVKLASEIGVGYRRAEDRLSRVIEGDTILRGGLNYEQKITSNTEIYDKFLVEAGETNTFLQNETGIKVAMNKTLALSVAYTIRHNTDVNESAVPLPEKTDELLTANLVFAF
jgi:putative salt-induced outer membrane protein